MLERASSCLEPATQNLFRSIEAPTRSQRRLPQAFWRHARIAREDISWWPEYLNGIRQAAQARERGLDRSILAQRAGPGHLPFSPQQSGIADNAIALSSRNPKPHNRRHISKVVSQSRTGDDKIFEEALVPENEEPPPPEVSLFAPEGIPEARKMHTEMTTGQRLEGLLRGGGEPDHNAVWLAFISLKKQAVYARAVLRYLCRSPSPVVLRRALRTFQMIEVDDRTHLTYESAVRAAIGLRKYATANELVLEALRRGLGVESSQFLMGHLVEKEMWKSAVHTLRVYLENTTFKVEQQSITNRHVMQHMFETPVWKTVDGMIHLPQKLLSLSRRLKENDPVLALDRADMESFVVKLLERALRSTTIMGVITPEGALALFSGFRELGLLHLQHYLDALSALRALRFSRNRSQLALLIFRNMRWVYPQYLLNSSTYGTMISILSAAPNEPEVFEYIFEDVTCEHGSGTTCRKVDLAMYQRVMSACAVQGHYKFVKGLLQRLIRDHGVPHDLAYFTPLLLSLAKRGDVKGTKRMFGRLSSSYGLQPNQQCWNILLLAHARADDFEGAAALFREMGSLGIPFDAYTFGTLMGMFSKAGDTRALLYLVDLAREREIPASTAMIDTIVHSYCLNGEVKEAQSLVEAATRMTLSGSPTRMWNILLRHHAFRADSGAVIRTQERMRELAIKPDGMTYAALMTSLVIIGKTNDAAAILRSLHVSQLVTASRFHYSIVFHGYVQEGQRDQAMVIYAEMVERFHRPSPSARLAMLHLQSQRDNLEAQRREADRATKWTGNIPELASPLQEHAIDYLADALALLEMADDEALPEEPQPGFQRRNILSAAPGLYLEVPFAALTNMSSYDKADELVQRYKAAIEASSMSEEQKSYQTVQLLTTQMRGLVKSCEGSGKSTEHLRRQSRRRIDTIWSRIFAETLKSAKEQNLGFLDYEIDSPRGEIISNKNLARLAGRAVAESSMVPGQKAHREIDGESTVRKEVARVIPAKRFALSAPLSVYMRGLVLQKRLPRLEKLLTRLGNFGFELTSKNWNTYIQLLSENKETVSKAFCVFEEKFISNTPPWGLLKRGKVLVPTLDGSLSADSNDPSGVRTAMRSRTMIEKRDPGQPVPTYFTVIQLAAAFLKLYSGQSNEDRNDKMSLFNELRSQAPGTVKFIQEMPLLKDRVQGVLLRGRALKGDPIKRPRKHQLVDRAGLLGSRSLLHVASSAEQDLHDILETTGKELQPAAVETKRPVTDEMLVSSLLRVPLDGEAPIKDMETKENLMRHQPHIKRQDFPTPTVATEADGDPFVEGLPSSWSPVLEGQSKQDSASGDFERRIASLRQLAEEHKPKLTTWRIRSRRNRGGSPRILAYPVKQANELMKPQGAYAHKSPLFTKPMLNMRVPRRRQLGSERRAFDLTKKYLDLKREREKEIRKAQARARKTKKAQMNRVGDNVVGFDGGIGVEETIGNDRGFLESRRVDHRAALQDEARRYRQSQSRSPGQGQSELIPGSSSDPEAVLVRAEEQRPTNTVADEDHAVTQRELDSDDFAEMQDRITQAQEKYLHAVYPHATKSKTKPTSAMCKALRHTAKAEEPLFPWGQTGMFDEADFMIPGQRSRDGEREDGARSHGK